MYAIEIENLTKSYGNFKAVDNLTLKVEKGITFGFLGPNGAGKTTTILSMIGLIIPDSGSIRILGEDVFREPVKVKERIGYLPENATIYEELTAWRNLEFFANFYKMSRQEKEKRIEELLKMVGLWDVRYRKVKTFSKGMKQRVMVARALVNKPEVLFLDEPTSGLDPVSSEEIRSLILEEREHGATVFLTTHDMHEADKLSDRVAFINKGKIVALDTPLNLKQKFGKRALKVKVLKEDGALDDKTVLLDEKDTPEKIYEIFKKDKIVTVHSEEATLEDIFIHLTGRGLE